MTTTFDVKLWTTRVRKGKRGTTYTVRWLVAGEEFHQTFKTSALADSFRSDLVTASRAGEAFDVETGLPAFRARQRPPLTVYKLACRYVDAKWPGAAATTRRTNAEALCAVVASLVDGESGEPAGPLLRRALTRVAFNTARRAGAQPADVSTALRWVEKRCPDATTLSDPATVRRIVDRLAVRLDGTPYAASVFTRRRKILNALLEWSVEQKLIDGNPMPDMKWKATAKKTVKAVDSRAVCNPVQARSLLAGVREYHTIGRRLVAYYACLYYGALRPEEAAGLRRRSVDIPAEGWGWLHLDVAAPHAGREWTNNGKDRDQRQLKQRDIGETRPVPCQPELTALLNWHIKEFNVSPNGLLFVGERNHSALPKGTVNKVWREVRRDVLTPDVAASPLARRPYDLRHAAVSTWLNAGIAPTQVAAWAGQSVSILLAIYAKCLHGGLAAQQGRIEDAME